MGQLIQVYKRRPSLPGVADMSILINLLHSQYIPPPNMATKASFTKTYHRKAYSSIDPSSPQLSHYGRAVLVTGAGSGIGRATAIAYAKAGAKHVILVGRRTDKLEDTQTEIKSLCKGTDISCHTIDIVDSDAVSTLVC